MAEKEYIEREAALAFQNEVEPLLCRNVVTHDIMSATKDADMVKYLQSIPAADVRPVVLCKDCKWTETDGMEDPAIYCEKWDRWEMPPDGFCWLGKKRKER